MGFGTVSDTSARNLMDLLLKNNITNVCELTNHITKDYLTDKVFELLAKNFELCFRAWKNVTDLIFLLVLLEWEAT